MQGMSKESCFVEGNSVPRRLEEGDSLLLVSIQRLQTQSPWSSEPLGATWPPSSVRFHPRE